MTNLNASYFTASEIAAMPFRSCGHNVLLHRRAIIVNMENIDIGSNVRIDANCALLASGPIKLGSYIHLGQGCYLAGRGGIAMQDFSGLSQDVKVYSASDDYTGRHLTNPTVPEKFLGLNIKPVEIGRHCIVGAGSVILPGASMAEGSALGALSLLNWPTEEWSVYSGNPAQRIMPRLRRPLRLEAQMVAEIEAARLARAS